MGGWTYPQTPSLQGRGWMATQAAMTGGVGRDESRPDIKNLRR